MFLVFFFSSSSLLPGPPFNVMIGGGRGGEGREGGYGDVSITLYV